MTETRTADTTPGLTRDEDVLVLLTLLTGVLLALGLSGLGALVVVALTAASAGAALGFRRAPDPLPRVAAIPPALVLVGSVASLPVTLLALPLGLAAGLLLLLWVGLPAPGALPWLWSRVGLELAVVALAASLALALALDLAGTTTVGTWVDLPFLLLLGTVVVVLLALANRPNETGASPV